MSRPYGFSARDAVCCCPFADARGLEWWVGAWGAREDVNNALHAMRLVRSRGYGEFKGICVCHTNQEVLLHSKTNPNRRPRAEDDTHYNCTCLKGKECARLKTEWKQKKDSVRGSNGCPSESGQILRHACQVHQRLQYTYQLLLPHSVFFFVWIWFIILEYK